MVDLGDREPDLRGVALHRRLAEVAGERRLEAFALLGEQAAELTQLRHAGGLTVEQAAPRALAEVGDDRRDVDRCGRLGRCGHGRTRRAMRASGRRRPRRRGSAMIITGRDYARRPRRLRWRSWRAACTSTPPSWRHASAAASASRTARRSASAVRRGCRPEVGSMRCVPSSGATPRSTTSSCASPRPACSAGVASRRARAGCRTVTSSRRPRRRSPSATWSPRAGSAPALRPALPTSDPPRRVVAPRRRPARPPGAAAGRRLADPRPAAPWPPAGVDGRPGYRARRVAVHRMRDGRLAAGDAPGHGGTRRRHRRHHPLVVGPGRLLRRPPRARRVGGPGPPPRRTRDGRHAGRLRRCSSTRPDAAPR